MLSNVNEVICRRILRRHFCMSSQRNTKVAVVGAAGGIGQPLCLLLKTNPLIHHLAMFDINKSTPGIALELSHVYTPMKVTAHVGPHELGAAITDADVIVVPAGLPRKPNMTRDDLFDANASIIKTISVEVAKYAPDACFAIITNPVNAMVPIAAHILQKAGVFDPNRVFGVTTLDIVRAKSFIGEINKINPATVKIPVIGGHAGTTIIPLLSQSQPPVKITGKEAEDCLIKRIQEAGTEVVKAKAGAGSATLSMAFAGAEFVDSLLRGLRGESCVTTCAYVRSDITKAPFFANPLMLGQCGVKENLGYGCVSEAEQSMIDKAIPTLIKDAEKGRQFADKKG